MDISDNLYETRNSSDIENIVGKRIRSLRNEQKLSSKELAEKVNVAESTIRNYEGGTRDVPEDTLSLIAQNLGVPIEYLRDHKIYNYVDAMQILFELSSAYQLEPLKVGNSTFALTSNNPILMAAIETWYNQKIALLDNKVSPEDYEKWKHAFPLKAPIDTRQLTVIHDQSDIARIMALSDYLITIKTLVLMHETDMQDAIQSKDLDAIQRFTERLINNIRTFCTSALERDGY